MKPSGTWAKESLLAFEGLDISKSKGRQVSFVLLDEEYFDENNKNYETTTQRIIDDPSELAFSLAEAIYHEIKAHIDLSKKKDQHAAYGKETAKVFDQINTPAPNSPAEKIKNELYDEYIKGFMENPKSIPKKNANEAEQPDDKQKPVS